MLSLCKKCHSQNNKRVYCIKNQNLTYIFESPAFICLKVYYEQGDGCKQNNLLDCYQNINILSFNILKRIT